MRPRIVLITDPRYEDDALVEKLDRALSIAPPGLVAVQLRDKKRETSELYAWGARLRPLCKERGALFVVNDRLDIALALEADGVHLGGASVGISDARELLGASSFVSVAAHSMQDVELAKREGADAALLSPIFASPGKGAPLGVSALTRARALAADLSLYALGGVDVVHAASCIRAGATGVAAIRAIFEAPEPADEMRRLLDAVGA